MRRSLVQVPPGVQCFVGEEARRRRRVLDRVLSVFEGWDYEEIIPPLLDYADVFASRELAARTYTFVGRDGAHLALRPDFTSLLAKIAAGRLADREPPIRLFYSGEVLRWEPPRAGAQGELHQMGVEHLGGDALSADVEALAIAAECLDALGVEGAVLAVGHVGVFHGLVAGVDPADPALDVLRDRVEARDESGVAEAARRLRLPEGPLRRLATGEVDAFDGAAGRALDELRARIEVLRAAGLGHRLTIDLGEVRGLDYYTGLVFRAYAPGLGFDIGAGGRYDNLLGRFGRALPAVGFMFGLDRLTRLLERQGRSLNGHPPDARRVRDLREARTLRAEGVRVRLT